MTNEERELITRFIERVAGEAPGQTAGFGGAVPATGAEAAPLPPIDPEADRLIAELFARYPEARYRITQMAFVQEHALVEAQNRIRQLQWELEQARAQAQAAAAGPQGSPWGAAAAPSQPSRGFLGGLFGGGAARSAPPPHQPYAAPPYQPPPAQYPPNYNPGLFQQQGPGFFGSALRTAAGVAGGMLAGEALMNLFSGGARGGFGGFAGGPGLLPGGANAAPANPWSAPPEAVPGNDPYDVGGAPKDEALPQDQSGGWAPAPDAGQDQGGGWDSAPDAGQDQGGGWEPAPDAGQDQGGWDSGSDGGDGGWSDPGGDTLI